MIRELRSPTVGVIVEVLVAPGDVVRQGQEIVVLESMKIHVPLKAPGNGIVQEVHAAAGNAVREGQLLVVLNSDGGSP